MTRRRARRPQPVSTVGTQRNQTSAPSARLPGGHPTQDSCSLPIALLPLPIPVLAHPVPAGPASAPSALGPSYLRLRAGAVGTGWPWLWAWLWPGGGAARLRAGSMPAGARPGRTAGLPMYGEPGGPMGAPWWGIRAPDGIPGRWGGGGEADTGVRRSDQGPCSRRGELRLSHPEPPARDPAADGSSEGWAGAPEPRSFGGGGLCVSLQEAN